MNERIKELALKSGFAYDPEKDNLWVSGSTELMISPGLEKFAELIVLECSAFVYNYPEKYLTRNQAREICLGMEKVFGVE